jgi:hypothetical protein
MMLATSSRRFANAKVSIFESVSIAKHRLLKLKVNVEQALTRKLA